MSLLSNEQCKLCCRCQQVKPANEFHRDSYSKSGRAASCKACKKQHRKKQFDKRKRPTFSINEAVITPDVEARFWSSADRSGDCWDWLAKHNNGGYGIFNTKRRDFSAHRFSYRMAHGSIPDGMHVLHSCDNRDCVNPAHLFLGTNVDNIADRVAKGRSNRNPKRFYTTHEQVREVRARHSMGERPSKIAADMGLPARRVYAIAGRENWKTVI